MNFAGECPFPIRDYPHVLMAHGGGGRLMHDLINGMFLPAFNNPTLARQHDAGVVDISGDRLAITTDSFVVKPLFFPGGDIGSLAVHGTVNDLAMAGARPTYLAAAFIIEEGLPMETLWRIVSSMREAAENSGISIVTGDTKVVDRGKGDGCFINTTGIGELVCQHPICPTEVRPGDAIIVSGDLGRHGMAVMALREGLEFESTIESDAASVVEPVLNLLESGIEVHCLRDLTRGGLTTALNEIAQAAKVAFEVTEDVIPVAPAVRAACEILGLDPLSVACEGRFVMFVPEAQVEASLKVLRSHSVSNNACRIGQTNPSPERRVLLRTNLGVLRILDMPSGEQLPRIC